MTTATRAQCQLTGTLLVNLPPANAFHLFTARGEQNWAPDWEPHFPTSVVDDSTPGTVFETDNHAQTTTWVVVDANPGRSIRYVRVTPHIDATIITVNLQDTAGHSTVTVTYDRTSLSADADRYVHDFATNYPTFLQSWQDAIAAHLASPDRSTDALR